MGMRMPQVSSCSVDQCAYNEGHSCHAMAITVGEPHGDPSCDTYFEASEHGGVKEMTAGVGACKLAECKFNHAYECNAPVITVAMSGHQPDCETFIAR